MIVIINQACLVIIIIIMSHHTSRRIGLHAAWPTLSVSCNSFGDFPVLPPCFVSLFFLFWSRFQKFWILVKFCCLCGLCQSPLKQKYSAIMSLTNKLSTKMMLSCATKLAVPSRWETNLTLSGANQNGLKIHFISSCHIVSHYRAFSFTWPASMQIYGSERNCLHKKSPTPTGFVWNANIAAVSLYWNTNMAAVTTCESGLK